MIKNFLRLLFCTVTIHCAQTLHAQGTAFTYQGQLNDGGSPANGTYDLRFGVFDAVTNGNAVSGSLTNLSVPASNGLFIVTLDFGTGIFTWPDRWLDIAVRAVGVTNFTALFPRQKITPTPYAIFANSASNLVGNLAAAQLTGTLPGSAFTGFTNSVILTNGANNFAGAFSGSGTNLVNLNASQLTGGTVADARLSSNVALLNANQTFSGANNFTNFGNSFVGSFFGNGLVGWVPTNGTAIQAQIDHGYLLTNSQVVTVTLPTNANAGDIVRISGAGAGGWIVAQVTNQSVLGNFASFAKSPWNLSSASTTLNWNSIASSSDGSQLAAVASGTGGGIFTSTDSGNSWSGPNGIVGAAWRTITSSSDGSKLVAAVNGGSVYTNSGTTWTAVGSITSGLNWTSAASSADGSKLLVTASGTGIFISANSGASWSVLANGSSWTSVASSSDGSKMFAVASGVKIEVSTNSGAQWTAVDSSRNWISIACSSDGSKSVAAVSGGGIYISTNSASWNLTTAPIANWISVASSSDGSKLAAAVTNSGSIYLSSNYGQTWTFQTNAPAKNWSAIASSSDGSKLAATVNNATSGGIYLSQASLQSSTTVGTNGYISGVQGSAVELQCIGVNQWMPVSSAGTIWAH